MMGWISSNAICSLFYDHGTKMKTTMTISIVVADDGHDHKEHGADDGCLERRPTSPMSLLSLIALH
jgi:hypothetical protein